MSQTQQKEETFLNCHCPQCRRPFDYVPISTDDCPLCQSPIDQQAVWLTRKYPGVLILPPWIKAFGWPFLLILAGIAYFLYPIFVYHIFESSTAIVSGVFIAIGLVFFVAKLNTNTDKY